jgi:hypothetical protein
MAAALGEHLADGPLGDEKEPGQVERDLGGEVGLGVFSERLGMNIPALLTRVSTRPNLATASPITLSATFGSAMSPATARTSGEASGLIERELATTR